MNRVRAECKKQCEIKLGQIMEKVNESKYLGSILCKHGSMDGEVHEKARKMVGSLRHMKNGRTVNMEIKKALHDTITVPKLT